MISEFAFGEAPFAADNAGIARAVIGAADAAVTSTSDPIRLRLFGASVSGAAAVSAVAAFIERMSGAAPTGPLRAKVARTYAALPY